MLLEWLSEAWISTSNGTTANATAASLLQHAGAHNSTASNILRILFSGNPALGLGLPTSGVSDFGSGMGGLLFNQYFGAGLSLMLLTWLVSMARSYINNAYYRIKSLFIYSITIEQTDEAYNMMLEYLQEFVPASKKSRSITIKTVWNDRHCDDYADDDNQPRKPSILQVPDPGTFAFRHPASGRTVWISHVKDEKDVASVSAGGRITTTKESITLSTLGLPSSKAILLNVVQMAIDYYYERTAESKTTLYICDRWGDEWKRYHPQAIRTLDSVILDEGMADQIIADAKRFMQSNRFYASLGIPWQRGYLLYGPPGTGKTSFILALAGELNLSVCICNVSSPDMSDMRLLQLFSSVPKKSIILLEDIDAAFHKRKKGDENKSSLTFSGLLNALDGIAAQDGRIVFMSTNHFDRLSPALTRPGRVDLSLKFDFSSETQIRGMFLKFYKRVPGEERSAHTLTDKEVGEAAEDFVKRIPSRTVTTAQLQCLLLEFRDDPLKAIARVPDFLEKAIAENKRNDNLSSGDLHSEDGDDDEKPQSDEDGESSLTTSSPQRSKSGKKRRRKSRKTKKSRRAEWE